MKKLKLMINRFICTILVFIFLSSLVIFNASADIFNEESETQSYIQEVTNELFGDISIKSCEYLYNLDGSPDFIYVEFDESGYVVYSGLTLDVLEYSLNGTLPYSPENKKYYAGPTSYVNETANGFKNIVTGEIIEKSDAAFFTEQSKKVLEQSQTASGLKRLNNYENLNSKINRSIQVSNDYDKSNGNISTQSSNSNENEIIGGGLGPSTTYINNAEYFITGPYHGFNATGTCSAVAAQLLLSYNNYYNDRRIISNNYLFDGEEGPNTCVNPMSITNKILGTRGLEENDKDDKNSYFHKIVEKIPASSSASKIRTGIDSLLYERKNELGINTDLAKVSYGTDLSVIKSEIDANRPIIISMHYNNSSNHAVIGYGYQTLEGSGTEEDGQFGYIVHYGWGKEGNWTNNSNVWINKNWCFNWVKMEVQHTHTYGTAFGSYYERVCDICGHRISDYPFDITVSNEEVSITGTNFIAPKDFIIPSRINDYPVTTIESNAFCDQSNIETLKIPNSVENIGEGAFSNCSNLTNITIPFTGASRNATGNSSYFGYIFGTSSYSGGIATNQNGTIYHIPSSLQNVNITDETAVKVYTFSNCNKLSKITLPYGTTSIGAYAFSGCLSLENFNIPRTVKIIETNAFSGCNKLHTLIIPYGVAGIGENAFPANLNVTWIYNPYYTASSLRLQNYLTIVKIENGVQRVESSAFANCSKLRYVYIHENVSRIGSNAFKGCPINSLTWYYNPNYIASQLGSDFVNLLTNVEIPLGINSIKANAFNNCNNLRTVKIRENVTSIGENAFLGCTSLYSLTWYYNPNVTAERLGIEKLVTYVRIPNDIKGVKVTEIKDSAFSNCTKLTTIDVGSKIRKIGNNAFSNCVNLTNITIPQTVITIGSNAFSNCINLRSIIIPKTVTTIGNEAFTGTNIVIYAEHSKKPERWDLNWNSSNQPVYWSIDYTNFQSTQYAEFVIQGGDAILTRFKGWSYNFTVPTNVTIDKKNYNVRKIGNLAMAGCTNLFIVIIPNCITDINSNAFKGCSSLEKITIPDSVTNIDSNAFEGCNNLQNVVLPNSLIRIKTGTFKNCQSLTDIIISNSVTNIDSNAFEGCSSLENITIPDSVTHIEPSTFEGCINLKRVSLSNNLTKIGINAFKGCSSLEKITMPDSVTHINVSAFEGCNNLQNVILSKKLIRIETNTFKNCRSLTDIIIPNSVTNIDSSAFEGCTSLENILLSTNLHTIDIAAFKGCSNLASIVLPSSVQYVNDEAFGNCSMLSSITVTREVFSLTNLGENVFNECDESLQIIVPTNRIVEYNNQPSWSSYKNKIVASSDYSELELSCVNNISESINLESGYNKLYKVNVWCAKTYRIVINAQSDVNIKIYNCNMDTLISSDNTIDIYLNIGTYYISFEFNNNLSYGIINTHFGLRWTSNGESIAYNADNNVLTHFHKTSTNNYRSRLYYNNQYGAGLYKFTLTGTNGGEDIIYPSNCIVIYSDSSRTTIIDRYTISNQLNPAVTCENENEMYVFLPDNSYFYIDVNMDECNYSSLTLKVEKSDNHTFDYSHSLDYSNEWQMFSSQSSNSYFIETSIIYKSKFMLDVSTISNYSNNIYIYILQKCKDPGFESERVYYIEPKLVSSINSESNTHSFSIILDAGTYYIGYSNNSGTCVSFDLTRVVNREINTYDTLVSDPGVGVPLGSEVTLNNGLYEGSTITEGFTRNLYLNYYEVNDYEVSRLKYDWYSSDPEIASVTLYGTVLAKSVNEDNEVKIYAVSKEDPSIVYCKYITILNETSSDEIDIEFSIKYSYFEENGTYKLQLDFSNSPYPLIQYYNWNVYPQDNINVSMNYWGEISSSGVGNAYIVGIYTLNPRVRLFINLTITE